MSHSEICPVCDGSGKVMVNTPNSTVASNLTLCHGCMGRGWIVVPDDPVSPMPVEPFKAQADTTPRQEAKGE